MSDLSNSLVADLVKRGIPYVTAMDIYHEQIKPYLRADRLSLLERVEKEVVGDVPTLDEVMKYSDHLRGKVDLKVEQHEALAKLKEEL